MGAGRCGGYETGEQLVSISQKIWVIKPAKSSDKKGTVQASVDSKTSKEQKTPTQAEASLQQTEFLSNDDREKKYHVLLTVFSYVLGPFAVFTTGQRRRSRFWASMAIGSGVASTLFIFRWKAFLSRSDDIGIAGLPLFLVACLAIIAGFAAWSHAVLLIGRNKRTILARMPRWIKSPWAAGSLGMLVPGFGLFIAGRSRRAVCALWSAGALLLSILVLSNGAFLWSWHHEHGSGAVSGHTVEFAFMALCAVGFLGGVGWIVQALDGARLTVSGYTKRGQSRSDGLAIILMAAIAALSVMFESGYVAEALDSFAASKRRDGFQIIPLYMTLGAMHIDPARPEYALHAIELYDEMGRHDDAEFMRSELRDRLMPCADLMRQNGMLAPYSISAVHKENTKAHEGTAKRRIPLLHSPAAGEIDSYMVVF